MFFVSPLDCSVVLFSSWMFSAWLTLLQEIAMRIVLAAKESTWPESSPIQREERSKSQRTSRTEVNHVRAGASASSPFPGTAGFCWEPTISSNTTTTNIGTRQDPVRETEKREYLAFLHWQDCRSILKSKQIHQFKTERSYPCRK